MRIVPEYQALCCAAYDLLEIVEEQRLQLVKSADGTVTEMILTTQPTVESVPLVGSVGMGCVTLHISSVPGFDGCEVSQQLQHSLRDFVISRSVFCKLLS